MSIIYASFLDADISYDALEYAKKIFFHFIWPKLSECRHLFWRTNIRKLQRCRSTRVERGRQELRTDLTQLLQLRLRLSRSDLRTLNRRSNESPLRLRNFEKHKKVFWKGFYNPIYNNFIKQKQVWHQHIFTL